MYVQIVLFFTVKYFFFPSVKKVPYFYFIFMNEFIKLLFHEKTAIILSIIIRLLSYDDQ